MPTLNPITQVRIPHEILLPKFFVSSSLKHSAMLVPRTEVVRIEESFATRVEAALIIPEEEVTEKKVTR